MTTVTNTDPFPLDERLLAARQQARDLREVRDRMRYWPPELRVLAGVNHARTYDLPYVYRWEEAERGWFRVTLHRMLVVTLPDGTHWKIGTPDEPFVLAKWRHRKLAIVLASKDAGHHQ
jgi:hypothetical protein